VDQEQATPQTDGAGDTLPLAEAMALVGKDRLYRGTKKQRRSNWAKRGVPWKVVGPLLREGITLQPNIPEETVVRLRAITDALLTVADEIEKMPRSPQPDTTGEGLVAVTEPELRSNAPTPKEGTPFIPIPTPKPAPLIRGRLRPRSARPPGRRSSTSIRRTS
jgi:hypothetical protein